jgi:hypothetical protein
MEEAIEPEELEPEEAPADFPVHDLGPWPENLPLRREDLYGDDER